MADDEEPTQVISGPRGGSATLEPHEPRLSDGGSGGGRPPYPPTGYGGDGGGDDWDGDDGDGNDRRVAILAAIIGILVVIVLFLLLKPGGSDDTPPPSATATPAATEAATPTNTAEPEATPTAAPEATATPDASGGGPISSLGFVPGATRRSRVSAHRIDPARRLHAVQIDRRWRPSKPMSRSIPSPNGRRTEAISDRLNGPSSGQPKPRSARPNSVSSSSASSVASHVAAPSGLNSLMTGTGSNR